MTSKHQPLAAALTLLLALAAADWCEGIIVRGDAPPSAVLVDSADFPEVVPLLGGRAVGTLVAENWVLTAAHVAEYLEVHEDARGVDVHGTQRRVVQVVLHPSWDEEKLGSPGVFDIALLRLDAPVSGAAVAPLYAGSDESGAIVALVGWGRTGDGVNPELVKDQRFRRGENRIDDVTTRLRFTFDPPDSENALPLEAVSGPGDSGGPAFLVAEGRRFLAGVSSFQQDEVSPGLYGVTENYERVSSHLEWIHNTLEAGPSPAD